MTPLGSRFSSSSLRRNGAALPCAFQSGRQTTWSTPRASAQLAAIFSTPGLPPCSRTMSSCLAFVRSSVLQTAAPSATFFPPVIAIRVPAGRCARVSLSLRARRKSRASMAAEVSLPVRLVCDPWRGRQTCPVSTPYASAAKSRMVSKASRRSPRFLARSVRRSSSRAFTSVPSWARSRSRISTTILSAVRSIRWACACIMFTNPHSRLSRSSASWVPSGATFSISVWTVCSIAARASGSFQTKRLSGSSGPGVAP